ncbi:MAG: hypothetical protein Kow0042_24890 [Calditrichia bacterium]
MKIFSLILLIVVLVFFTADAADFKVNGVYTAWGQSQHAFNFNEKTYDHNYVVQMLRFNIQGIANENLKFVTRLDLAQGWWGVDNSLRSVNRNETKEKTLGASRLFDYKDTNYLIHVDQAYIDFSIPNTPFSMRVGRMWYGLGNRIMVDNNYDGVQIDLNEVVGKKLTFSWAKVSEGVDNLSDDKTVAADDRGFTDARDAHLVTLNFHNKAGAFSYDAYGLYYNDASTLDMNAYIPDHLQFFKTRFSSQVTELTAFGLAATYQAGKLKLNGEVDYLMGEDEIGNTTHGAKQMWDINNGDLSGFNVYLNMNYAATDVLSLGAVAGIGSGDDDLTSGKGNVNKLRTSGFFYITEVWEDSIMPDEEGITPQGLGAPNVRGYRELENTTIFQVNATVKPIEKLTGFLSYNYIRATQPIHGWGLNESGDTVIDPDVSSSDIGQEVDFRLSYQMFKELDFTLRGGYFIPGDAAGYLILGHTKYDDPAWELKSTITYKF